MADHEKEMYRLMLRETAKKLEAWADQSIQGGWSTHLVQPCRDEAERIYALLGKFSR